MTARAANIGKARNADLATARAAARPWAKPRIVSALRQRLTTSIAAGLDVNAIASRLRVHRNTVVLWAQMLAVESKLKAMLNEGLAVTTAAARLGVHANTVHNWVLLLELKKQPRCARCGRRMRGCRGHRFIEGRR